MWEPPDYDPDLSRMYIPEFNPSGKRGERILADEDVEIAIARANSQIVRTKIEGCTPGLVISLRDRYRNMGLEEYNRALEQDQNNSKYQNNHRAIVNKLRRKIK